MQRADHDDAGGEQGDGAARLELGRGDAERDVEREDAGAVGLDEREHERAGADRAEQRPARHRVDRAACATRSRTRAARRSPMSAASTSSPRPCSAGAGSVWNADVTTRMPSTTAKNGRIQRVGRCTLPTIGRVGPRRHRRPGGDAAPPTGAGGLVPRADDGAAARAHHGGMLLSAPPTTGAATAITVRGLRVSYGDVEAVRGIDLDVRTRGDPRAARSQRRRQDVHRRGPRGLPGAHRRRDLRARRRPAPRPARLARAARHRAAGLPARARADRARVPAPVRGLLQRAARRRGDDRPGRARGARGPRGLQALRRPAAAARRRARADRRPRAGLPRRADDGLRPRRAAAGVGGHRRAARAREDDRAHHPLHGGGRAAGRPDRGHGARRDRRRRHARRRSAGATARPRSSRSPCPAARPARRRAARSTSAAA